MKYTRRAAKRDQSEPAIVEALEKAGWSVYRELPVDLLCLKRVGDRVQVRLLEAKTPQANGKQRKRNDQREQAEFCERFSVPYVCEPFAALLAVGESVEL